MSSNALVSMGDDMDVLCLVKECRELEKAFGTNVTDNLLEDGNEGVSKQNIIQYHREGEKVADGELH